MDRGVESIYWTYVAGIAGSREGGVKYAQSPRSRWDLRAASMCSAAGSAPGRLRRILHHSFLHPLHMRVLHGLRRLPSMRVLLSATVQRLNRVSDSWRGFSQPTRADRGVMPGCNVWLQPRSRKGQVESWECLPAARQALSGHEWWRGWRKMVTR